MKQCVDCGAPVTTNSPRCEPCRKTHYREYRNEYQKWRYDNDVVYREKVLASVKKYKKKRYEKIKLRFYIKYGPEAEKRFMDIKGICEKKGCSDPAILVHHLNENQEDNRYDNFRMLCKQHHRHTHLYVKREFITQYPNLVSTLGIAYLDA